MVLFRSQGLGLLLTTLFPLAYSATILPRLNNVTMELVVTNGHGCPKGTVSSTLNRDGTVATFGFDTFEIYFGPGSAPGQRVKDCIINLKFDFPLGYTFEFVDSTYHGSARLDSGMDATMGSSYFTVTGDQQTIGDTQTRVNIVGEMVGEYTKTNAVPAGSGAVSACGHTTAWTYLTTRLGVRSNSASPVGGVDDGPVASLAAQQVQLRWVPCR